MPRCESSAQAVNSVAMHARTAVRRIRGKKCSQLTGRLAPDLNPTQNNYKWHMGACNLTLAERSNTLEEFSALLNTLGWKRLIWSAREGTSVVLPTDNSVRVAIEREWEREDTFFGHEIGYVLLIWVPKTCPPKLSLLGSCARRRVSRAFFTAASFLYNTQQWQVGSGLKCHLWRILIGSLVRYIELVPVSITC